MTADATLHSYRPASSATCGQVCCTKAAIGDKIRALHVSETDHRATSACSASNALQRFCVWLTMSRMRELREGVELIE